jgi:hypothetical protein
LRLPLAHHAHKPDGIPADAAVRLPFDDDQDEHKADGGIYLGMGQVALLILGVVHRMDPVRAVGGMPFSADNTLLTWSWIIET